MGSFGLAMVENLSLSFSFSYFCFVYAFMKAREGTKLYINYIYSGRVGGFSFVGC